MDLLNNIQSLNKGKTIYVDYKISKNGSTIRVFSSFLVNFSKKYVSIKGVFNVWIEHLSDFKVELVIKSNYIKFNRVFKFLKNYHFFINIFKFLHILSWTHHETINIISSLHILQHILHVILKNYVTHAEVFAKKLDIFTQNPKNTVFLTIFLPSHWNLTIPYLNTLRDLSPVLIQLIFNPYT